MDKETVNQVVQISEAMRILEVINKQIRKANLSFITGNHYDAIMPFEHKKIIQDILFRHETEIRDEINDRYNDLKKQIEEL